MNTDPSSPVAPGPAASSTVVPSTAVPSPVVASAVPDKPTLAGIEDKWMRRWAKERVVQV